MKMNRAAVNWGRAKPVVGECRPSTRFYAPVASVAHYDAFVNSISTHRNLSTASASVPTRIPIAQCRSGFPWQSSSIAASASYAQFNSRSGGLSTERAKGLRCRSSSGKHADSAGGGREDEGVATPAPAPVPVSADGGNAVSEKLESVEASRIIEEGDPVVEANTLSESSFEQLPASEDALVKTMYSGLMAVHGVVGACLIAATVVAPSAVVPEAACGSLSMTMVGITGAVMLRAASLMLFVKESLERGELGTLRVQRLNAAFIVFGLTMAVALLPSVTAAPLVTIPLLVVSLATAGAALLILKLSLSLQPFMQYFVVPGDAMETAARWYHLVVRDLTTISGVLSYMAAAAAVLGATALLCDLGSWQTSATAHQLSNSVHESVAMGSGGPGSTAPVVAVLRRVAGAGFILSAATSHALLDFCDHVRNPHLMEAIYQSMMERMMSKDPVLSFLNPPAKRYNTLHLATGLVVLVQAYFLWQATCCGVDVNFDAAYWGPLFGNTALWLLYLMVSAGQLDWLSVQRSFMGLLNWVFGFVGWFFDTLVVPWESMKDLRSRAVTDVHVESTWLKNVKTRSD